MFSFALFQVLSLLCCVPVCVFAVNETCDNGKGVCIDTSTTVCDGLLKSGYCPGGSTVLCCEAEAASVPERCLGAGPPLLPRSYLFTLENQGFAGHPGALVYVPTNFALRKDEETSSYRLNLVVWIHGFNNCVSNVVRNQDESCNCSSSQDVRVGYNLIDQFESASLAVASSSTSSSSTTNTLFIAAEVAYDLASDAPGRWAEQGLFKKFVDELLDENNMTPILGLDPLEASLSSANVDRIRIFSHSGGYFVIGNMYTVGGLQQSTRELVLFDSLYADFPQFDAFCEANMQHFGNGNADYRFSSLYTKSGGTYDNNVAMAARAMTWAKQANMSSSYYYDNSLQPLDDAVIAQFPLLFKLMNLTHDEIPQQMAYHWFVDAL